MFWVLWETQGVALGYPVTPFQGENRTENERNTMQICEIELVGNNKGVALNYPVSPFQGEDRSSNDPHSRICPSP